MDLNLKLLLSEAITALSACLIKNDRAYVRLVAIRKRDRFRLTEMMVQRPS